MVHVSVSENLSLPNCGNSTQKCDDTLNVSVSTAIQDFTDNYTLSLANITNNTTIIPNYTNNSLNDIISSYASENITLPLEENIAEADIPDAGNNSTLTVDSIITPITLHNYNGLSYVMEGVEQVSWNDLKFIDVTKKYNIDNKYTLAFDVSGDTIVMLLQSKENDVIVKKGLDATTDPIMVTYNLEDKTKTLMLINSDALKRKAALSSSSASTTDKIKGDGSSTVQKIDSRLLDSAFLKNERYIIGEDEVSVIIRFNDAVNNQAIKNINAQNNGVNSANNYDTNTNDTTFEKSKLELLSTLSEKKISTADSDNPKEISESTLKELQNKTKIRYNFKTINSVAAVVRLDQLDALKNAGYIKDVQLDEKVHILLDTSVPQIAAPTVWAMKDSSGTNVTGVNVTIAIIDTGVDYTHPDLGGCTTQQFLDGNCKKVIGGYDFINNDNDPMDDMGHGTHVAATAAGNGILKGVAPGASIVAYKVLDSSGSGYSSDIIAGMERAADPNGDGNYSDHCDIASMSLGGGGDESSPLSQEADYLVEKGVVLVVAAGNSGPYPQSVGSPASSPNAITVGATCKTSGIGNDSYCTTPIADFSSRGPTNFGNLKPDVLAPGHKICAAEWGDSWSDKRCLDDKHVAISGTSMATPHVAGAAALLLQMHPDWNPEDVKSALAITATDLNMSAYDQGSGQINLSAAINPGISVYPAVISFGKISGNTSTIISIKNLKNTSITLSIIIGNATNGVNTAPALSYTVSNLTIPAHGTKLINLSLKPGILEGAVYGHITLNDGTKSYKVQYGFSAFSTLHVNVISPNHRLQPDIIIHKTDFSTKYVSFYDAATRDPDTNAVSFNVPQGEYYVYAIGEPSTSASGLNYILIGKTSLGLLEEKTFNLYYENLTPVYVKAESKSGVPLLLYEWNIGVRAYIGSVQGYYEENKMFYNLQTSQYGNRTIYISDKPQNDNITIDIIFSYHGVPTKSPTGFGDDYSKGISGLYTILKTQLNNLVGRRVP
jgi:subtilisin family serine protease